jgi:hypothetical protein
MYSKNVKSLEC